MAEKMYKVISEKYTGKHNVYKKGAEIPESEVFGDLKIALEGQKEAKASRNRKLPDVKPSLKLVTKAAKK